MKVKVFPDWLIEQEFSKWGPASDYGWGKLFYRLGSPRREEYLCVLGLAPEDLKTVVIQDFLMDAARKGCLDRLPEYLTEEYLLLKSEGYNVMHQAFYYNNGHQIPPELLTEKNLQLKTDSGKSLMDIINCITDIYGQKGMLAYYNRMKGLGKLPGQKPPSLAEQLAVVDEQLRTTNSAALMAALLPTAERLRTQIAEEASDIAVRN